jgi:DnaD/phage-associated family protein
MKTFSGFPIGKLAYTPLPDLFFGELLPGMDSLAELKVTLHAFWLMYRRRGTRQYVSLQELLQDSVLLQGLKKTSDSPELALREGLAAAVARGTLLCLAATEGDERFYFVNSGQGRRAFEQAQSGELDLAEGKTLLQSVAPQTRPNIFVLYEQNIGLLQPMIAEELQEAERTYPQQWIEEAFRIAIENNVRNLKYIRRILERWATEGKDEGKGKSREKTWYTEEEEKLIKR